MDTIVKDFGFFVEACHVPPVQNVVRLLGMEHAHLADIYNVYNLQFYWKGSLLLLELPNITAKSCWWLIFWIIHICSVPIVSISKILRTTNIGFNITTRCHSGLINYVILVAFSRSRHWARHCPSVGARLDHLRLRATTEACVVSADLGHHVWHCPVG